MTHCPPMRMIANVAAMAGRGGRRARVVVVGALVLASCSSDEGAEPAPPELSVEPLESTSSTQIVSDPTSPATTPATVAPVETPASSSSTSSTSTEPPAPTTEPAPSTTTLDDLRAEIEADLNEGEAVFLAGAGDPGSEQSRVRLRSYFAETGLQTLLDFYESLESEGRQARPNPAIPSTTRVLDIDEAFGDEATILRCRIDAAVVYELDGSGAEVVVNDDVGRFTTRSKVLFREGIWRLAGGETLEVELGETTCDGP